MSGFKGGRTLNEQIHKGMSGKIIIILFSDAEIIV